MHLVTMTEYNIATFCSITHNKIHRIAQIEHKLIGSDPKSNYQIRIMGLCNSHNFHVLFTGFATSDCTATILCTRLTKKMAENLWSRNASVRFKKAFKVRLHAACNAGKGAVVGTAHLWWVHNARTPFIVSVKKWCIHRNIVLCDV